MPPKKEREHNWGRGHYTQDGWCKHGGCPRSGRTEEEREQNSAMNMTSAPMQKKHIADYHPAFVGLEYSSSGQPTLADAAGNPLQGAGALSLNERWAVLFAVCNLPVKCCFCSALHDLLPPFEQARVSTTGKLDQAH